MQLIQPMSGSHLQRYSVVSLEHLSIECLSRHPWYIHDLELLPDQTHFLLWSALKYRQALTPEIVAKFALATQHSRILEEISSMDIAAGIRVFRSDECPTPLTIHRPPKS